MKKANSPGSRRRFLALGLLGGASVMAQPAQAIIPEDDTDTVKMLTADGQLVEVPKSAVQAADEPKKAAKREILDWAKPPKSTK